MSFHAHVEALSERHAQLERELKEELRHPRPDDLRVRQLKRTKLRLKDQMSISRLQPA